MKTLITAALTSHLLDDVPAMPSRLWRELRPTVAQDGDVSEWSAKNLSEADGEIVRQRMASIDRVQEALDALGELSIMAIDEFDERYPRLWLERLGGKHPPLLFVSGSADLLNAPSIGVVGSRDVDEAGREFAAEIAREAVGKGHSVVSGGARGVDQVAMRAAFESGGASIGFLSDSLERMARSRDMAESFESGEVCLATPFSPSAGFSVGNAMARNKLIYAHSLATVVVSSSADSGGTWSGAVEALSGGWCPVLVRSAESAPDGNRMLIKKGGMPLESASELSQAIEQAAPLQASLL